MTSAYALLILAMQLLMAVSNNPNVSPALALQAQNTANYAINYAQSVINAPTSTPTISTQSTPQTTQTAPILYGSISPMNDTQATDKSALTTDISQVQPPSADNPYGLYFIKVRVLDSSGNPTCGTFCENPRDPNAIKIPVVMTSTEPNFRGNSTSTAGWIDTVEGQNSTDWFTTFSFAPSSKDPVTLTFTSGTLANTVSIASQ